MTTRDIIRQTAVELQGVCDQVYGTLSGLGQGALTEMVHEAQDVRRSAGGKERLAAEIVEAEAQVILEERKEKK